MTLAYLILAHANPSQLQRLVQKLSNNQTDIYIHIDAKARLGDFTTIAALPNVYFVTKREKVYWGAYSIVQATVNGFEQMLATGKPYDFITLLSGQDYPLKTNAKILDFFKANPNKAFMEFYTVNDVWQEAIPRLNKYYLTNYPFAGSTKLEQILNKLLPKRQPPKDIVFVGRSQWFTITLAQAKYIVTTLATNRQLRRFFRFTWGSDEFVFQTLLYNSPFKVEMINDNLRYIDWSSGGASPRTLTMADAPALLETDKLFARKFNVATDVEILNTIDASNQQPI
ncbi:beta-1,6-N-acetylglucosaminyltransferase [Parasediminibacterium paludis]|uniref:Peptide O-xylosyltransferase n=1 Tax=Parasediminibacterium paludis TaxID=908966 RepID=A0ABV8PVQ5_9BACT